MSSTDAVATIQCDLSHWPVIVMRGQGRPSDQEMDAYLQWYAKHVIAPGRVHANLLDVGEVRMTREQTQMLTESGQKLHTSRQKCVRGVALVFDSWVMQCLFTAMTSVIRPTDPVKAFKRFEPAFRWCKQMVGNTNMPPPPPFRFGEPTRPVARLNTAPLQLHRPTANTQSAPEAEPTHRPQRPPTSPPAEASPAWTVQLGAFRTRDRADTMVTRLESAGYANVELHKQQLGGHHWWVARVGAYTRWSDAEEHLRMVREIDENATIQRARRPTG